jgi:hypothetical protein
VQRVLSLGIWGAGFLLLGGCESAGINNTSAREIADARIQTESALVLEKCPDGAEVGPNCGLLTRRYRDDDFLQRFREASCAEKTPDECEVRYQRMISARLHTRYFAAKFEDIDHSCDVAPAKCDDPAVYEGILRESHNAEIRRRGVQTEQDIELARRAAQARYNDAVSGLAVATSTALSTMTWCRTYPSVFGQRRAVVGTTERR